MQNCDKVFNVILFLYPVAIFRVATHDGFGRIFHKIMNHNNVNLLNEFGQNFIYKINSLNNIIKILDSDLELNVNHTDNKGITFVMYYTHKTIIAPDQFEKFLCVLKKRNYDFNNVFFTSNNSLAKNMHGLSIFDAAFNTSSFKQSYEILNQLIKIPELDITKDLLWFKRVMTFENYTYEQQYNLSILLFNIMERHDYSYFLINIIKCYLYSNAENDLMLIISICKSIQTKKLNEIINQINENSNTFIHYAAMLHYKKLIINIINTHSTKFKPNNNRDCPIDLYKKK